MHGVVTRGAATLVALGMAVAGCTAEAPRRSAGSERVVETAAPASPSATAEDDRMGGTLRYALGANPSAIDPRFVEDEDGAAVADALFDSLVALDDDLEVVPAAASDWVANSDGSVYEFQLRDAAFHDGTPVTAHEFVRSFRRLVDATAEPRAFGGYRLAAVKGYEQASAGGAFPGVEALDDRRLRITLQRPFAEFLQVLADPVLAPVPPAADEDPAAFGRAPVGNGPFQMSGEWQQDDFIRVARYDGYRPEPALLDEVVFQIYADDERQQDQWAEFEAGRLDFAQVPSVLLQEARDTYGASEDGYRGPGVLDGLTSTVYYYGFNTQQPPFDDPKVRQAVSRLIDRETIVEQIMEGAREVSDAIVPPPLPAHQADACPDCDFDPQAAAALIEQRPVDARPLTGPVTILHNSGATHAAVAETVATAVEATLGVEVVVESQEFGEFVQALHEGEMGIFRLGWQAEHPGAGSVLYPLFHSSSVGENNLTRYTNSAVDRLLDRARAERDPEVRRRLYRDVERRVLADAAVAPIFVYRHNRIVADDVKDFRLSPFGRVDLRHVWLDAEAST